MHQISEEAKKMAEEFIKIITLNLAENKICNLKNFEIVNYFENLYYTIYDDGLEAGKSEGYEEGYANGYNEGYDLGFNNGKVCGSDPDYYD